ncbi:hypothetical protein [Streptomyces sp. SM14]|uniref:hypothetical protein n=1 Tax=Streptomyces sp. SM14 TaxID=1736045 RepID=UPI000CD5C08E|nr:hypothetical protein [Streptomyces sp. SM14]
MTEPDALDGFWAETVVRSPDAGGEWHLGGRWSPTPQEAVGWMREQAWRVAVALDPEPFAGPFAPAVLEPAHPDGHEAARTFREWAEDAAYQRLQADALAAGRPVSVNTRGPDRICGLGEVEVFYSLSARPVRRRVALTGRSGLRLIRTA